jgi:hypothetical protein
MDEEMADTIVGLAMVPLALLGLLLASGAMDAEMSVFGGSLAAFASIFGFSVLKAHFDRADAERVALRLQAAND